MSHGDKVTALPDGFTLIAETPVLPDCRHGRRGAWFYAVQFHPEVTHTKRARIF